VLILDSDEMHVDTSKIDKQNKYMHDTSVASTFVIFHSVAEFYSSRNFRNIIL